jgi:osmotically-inducible protein OsmY
MSSEPEMRPSPAPYLVESVREALAHDPRLAELHVEVTVAGSLVLLRGEVDTPERREIAGQVAQELLPGHEVRNELSVTPSGGGPKVERLS